MRTATSSIDAGRLVLHRRATGAALLLCTLLLAACSSEPAFTRQLRKEQLIDAVRDALLESVEAEKSAVLSTSDQESLAFARESQHDSAEIDRMTAELRPLVEADDRAAEVEQLAAFERTWKEVRSVDERLLALAVANTDLKASHLAASEGAAQVDRFVDQLSGLEPTTSDPAASPRRRSPRADGRSGSRAAAPTPSSARRSPTASAR